MADHDYDTLFRNLAARGFEVTIMLVSKYSRSYDARNPWWVSLRGHDSFGAIKDYEGYGPLPYFALLAARSHVNSEIVESERNPPPRKDKPKVILGFGSNVKDSAKALLAELEL